MAIKKLNLEVITQEKSVFKDEVDLILAPGHYGQIGILPGHIGLLTKLQAGELYIVKGPTVQILAVTGGLLDVHDNIVSVMADNASRADEIDIKKVEAAMKAAKETLKQKLSTKEFAIAEADLRKAVLELKVVKKRHHHKNPLQR